MDEVLVFTGEGDACLNCSSEKLNLVNIIQAKSDFINKTMGKAVVKLYIATYAEEEYVVEVACKKGDIDELIISRAWKKIKEDQKDIPYGTRSAEIIQRED